jgi:hypothetical protein
MIFAVIAAFLMAIESDGGTENTSHIS